MTRPSEQLRQVAEHRGTGQPEVLAAAFERGLEALWTEVVIERYLAGELTREGAIELVGGERVREAEREASGAGDDGHGDRG